MTNYPDTKLVDDELDPELGGEPASAFGQPAWQWINAVVRVLSRAYLNYLRVAYSTVVVHSKSAAAAGDIAVFVAGNYQANVAYDVRKYISGLDTPMVLGVYAEPVSAEAKARIIIRGILPAATTNLGARSASANVGLDTTVGRLRVAQVGDLVLGTVDRQGNVLFTGYGVEAP